MLNVMTIVGTRPEIIKLSRVIPELDKHTQHTLVHTGQNWDPRLRQVFFDELGIRQPDMTLSWAGTGPAKSVAYNLSAVDAQLVHYKPDAVLVLGDTNSALSVYAAKRRHIPIFHAEAGNRCFDERVPEEVNRRIVDHIADINMPYTEHARRNLLAEGIAPDRIIKTGSPMREVISHYNHLIAQSDILNRLSLPGQGYFVVSAHREENVDDPRRLLALAVVAERLAQEGKVVWPLHPRTQRQLEKEQLLPLEGVQIIEPLGFLDYAQLQAHARCVISDSGTLTEEAELLRFPAVMIRQAHERPEGMDAGTTIMSDLKTEQVLKAVAVAVEYGIDRDIVPDYLEDLVSRKVVRTILSYTDYVRRRTYAA